MIATGGLSIPKMGATGFGYRVAAQFGLTVLPTRAGLVPFTFADADPRNFKDLAGVAFDAEVRCNGASFSEAVLFTHQGISGLAILQISSYWPTACRWRSTCCPDRARHPTWTPCRGAAQGGSEDPAVGRAAPPACPAGSRQPLSTAVPPAGCRSGSGNR